ncbi:MAG TPA: branched-chain amino acid ABC transporter permease [Stellaceae bacterium]|jgi:branched-chain amino acid transport system permease protein/neutral amino acid transport system permease protein|nr:branched-chain amino acid ABC transporter permease [Stellaceae bacterium]
MEAAAAHVTQLVLNGIMTGAILMMPAIGLTLIYGVLRFPNFAVAAHATIGAFAGFLANTSLGWPLIPSLFCAFAAAAVFGALTDEFVLKSFRPSGSITTAIASVALTIAIENIVRFFFGNDLRGYVLPITRDWRIAGLRIGPQQVENLGIAVVAVGVLFAFLSFARTGKAMRAVADNPMLASIKGINAEMIGRLVSFVGMGLAGLGGMLTGLDTTIDPLTGFRTILSVFAAAVVGGLGSVPGAVIGALTVGIGEELCLLVLPPEYRSVVGFLVILVVLTLRPRGILGQSAY